jgi:hypothetical protein
VRRTTVPRSGSGKPVTDAPHRLDQARVADLVSQLLAEFRNVLVEGPGFRKIIHPPAAVEKGVAIDRFSAPLVEE